MIDIKNSDGIYFVGIGGIGMSALALYFVNAGYRIAGYDRSETSITKSLSEKGCAISYEDNVESMPCLFRDLSGKNKILVVYTPAIPFENRILSYFGTNGYRVHKRSEILGVISSQTDTIAVAGTHGKTTISTMIAHILKQSHVDCSAFLGGISKNYDSNFLQGTGRYTVMEADEFDRSFHRLSPKIAVITSLDADHLDIYGDHDTMIRSYNEFINKIRPGGILIANKSIFSKIIIPDGVTCSTYGTEPGADYRAFEIIRKEDFYSFNIQVPRGIINDLHLVFPGVINVVNMTAAISVALICGVTEQEVRKSVVSFKGVKRRFDIRINMPGLVYIDDYAHHPEEIKACVDSVKEVFSGRKITGIFQPHLYSRTRDHAEGFAGVLDRLDEVIILPVYPAREKPIEGVSSELIFMKMKSDKKQLAEMDEIPGKLDVNNLDILLTIGAGDIENLVEPIETKLKMEFRK
jgi:UDP-N-acetylmuramate--alanine ligase